MPESDASRQGNCKACGSTWSTCMGLANSGHKCKQSAPLPAGHAMIISRNRALERHICETGH
eukprot:665330-Pelagomonas_calceolata.AAC.5